MKLTTKYLKGLILEQLAEVANDEAAGDEEVLQGIHDLCHDMSLNITALSNKSMQMAILQHVTAIQSMVDAIMMEIDEDSQEMSTRTYDEMPPL